MTWRITVGTVLFSVGLGWGTHWWVGLMAAGFVLLSAGLMELDEERDGPRGVPPRPGGQDDERL